MIYLLAKKTFILETAFYLHISCSALWVIQIDLSHFWLIGQYWLGNNWPHSLDQNFVLKVLYYTCSVIRQVVLDLHHFGWFWLILVNLSWFGWFDTIKSSIIPEIKILYSKSYIPNRMSKKWHDTTSGSWFIAFCWFWLILANFGKIDTMKLSIIPVVKILYSKSYIPNIISKKWALYDKWFLI